MPVLAVDVGSTSARAGMFAADGRCLARAEAPFATARPLADHAEHDWAEIWGAVCAASRAALAGSGLAPGEVTGLAFDATCSLAVFDRAGRPVSVSTTGDDAWSVVMWADHRATVEAAEITATGHKALRHVGGVMSPEMQLPKLLWLKRHLPASWARMGLALDLADALAWRATGRIAVSACTVGCKWSYLNHAEPGWQHDLLAEIGLADLPQRANLPERAQPIGARSGTLTPYAAAELGLTTSCMVGIGLIDAHAGGVALLGGRDTATLNRSLAMIAGTSTCHMAVAAEPRFVPGIWGPYQGAMLPGLWLNEGGQSATGALLDHILDWHAGGCALGPDRHTVVSNAITARLRTHGPAFTDGLRVLPDFNGNRSPHANPLARGVIEGLTLDASFDSLLRLYYAAATGIALGTREIIAALNQAGYAISRLHLTGGHAASPTLPRLYADATGCTVITTPDTDSVLLGTACVAGRAAQLYPDLASAAQAMRPAEVEAIPDPATKAYFDVEYAAFLEMRRSDSYRTGSCRCQFPGCGNGG